MPKPIRILTLAAKETRKAWLWYRARSARAARRFQEAFERAVEQIQEQPDRWPKYLHDTQFVTLKRFPYLVVFRELDDDLQIIAVAHAHRRPGYWKKRLT